LAFGEAIMLAMLSVTFTTMAEVSAVLSESERQQVAQTREDDAEWRGSMAS
jgi:hypothetical protein